jgi:hypothetical protein
VVAAGAEHSHEDRRRRGLSGGTIVTERLFNSRQEEERSKALLKSKRNSDAVRTRYVRKPDVVPRALARPDYDLSEDLNTESGSEITKLAQAVQDDLRHFETWFERQYARHPKKGNRILAEQAAVSAYQDHEFTLEAFEKCHAAWCASEEWRWKGGAKAPHLANWINDKGFRYLPEGAIEQPRTKEYDSEKDMREHMEDEKRRAARAARPGCP